MCNCKISSNLLFHFTQKVDTLISILENGFYPMTAIEDISFMMPNYSNMRVGIPMVCFTDIPLDIIEDHQKKYGEYGLGMKKEWGIKKGINPVGYIIKGSNAQKAFNKMQKNLQEIAQKIDSDAHSVTMVKALDCVMNYAGFLRIYSDESDSIPYYNEREWRYLPPFMDEGVPPNGYCNRLMYNMIDNEQEKAKLNKHMIKKYTLKFAIDDIEKIILPESGVEKFIESIRMSTIADQSENYIAKLKP